MKDIETYILEGIGERQHLHLTLDALPPTDNRRLLINRQGRKAPTPEYQMFKNHIETWKMCEKPQLPPPPVFLFYRPIFKDRRRDAQNCSKALVDCLYGNDKYVYPCPLPPKYDKKKQGVEVWIVPIEE
jgi:hypothetical protein